MNILRMGAVGALLMMTAPATADPAGSPGPWNGCCGTTRWPPAAAGSDFAALPRHRAAMSGIPAPYTSARNPLAASGANIKRGAAVFDANCASCHGQSGAGDGEEGQYLSPRPGNLAGLASLPLAQRDPFMAWTIREGGAPFGTAMPAFKDKLSSDDIWAVIGYIQARLPQK